MYYYVPGENIEIEWHPTLSLTETGRYYRRDSIGRKRLICVQGYAERASDALRRAGYTENSPRWESNSDGTYSLDVRKIK
jgi:hypothetical protein